MELFFVLCDQKNFKNIFCINYYWIIYFTALCMLSPNSPTQLNRNSIPYYHTEIQFEDQVRH